jgi:hypothetical protein
MTVSQLIEELKNYPQDLPVVVSGYEGGYNDVDAFENIDIVLDYHTAWYYGRHEDVKNIYNEDKKKNALTVAALRIA